MKPVRVTFVLQFYGELPDDDGEADARFDDWETEIADRLNEWKQPDGIARQSFAVIDAATFSDESTVTTEGGTREHA